MAGRPEIRREPAERQPDAAAPAGAATAEATPSMAQYLEIKAANPDSLLWYRMGDFYELFFQDAVVAAEALGIVLTKRGKHLGDDIPMCGVPVVRADEYLQKLIRKGYRVAVCEQLEDPAEARKRGSKAVVRRDVVRLVTPGTLTEDTLLDAKARNYLSAVFLEPADADAEDDPGRAIAVASLDISTGDCEIGTVVLAEAAGELSRLAPGEILATDRTLRIRSVETAIGFVGAAATPVAASTFDSLAGERLLKERLGVLDLAAFGAFTAGELAAAGALLRYVDVTQIGQKPLVRPPRRTGSATVLVIDAASRASLEIVRASSGDKSGSLLAAVDRTVTGPGARELAHRIASPLRDPRAIMDRLDAVACLVERSRLRDDLRQNLRSAPDVARAVSRLSLQRGGPRDLAAVRDGLLAGAAIAARLDEEAGTVTIGVPTLLAAIAERATAISKGLAERLTAALIDDPPHLKRDGGFVRLGYRTDLDQARQLRDDSRRVIAELETRYVETTGVRTLKIKHNNILGYFVEVGQANAKPLQQAPLTDVFRHRQSMANAMRFATAELTDIEGRIASASERALAIEQEIFAELAQGVLAEAQGLAELAAALADLDVYAGLAELAVAEGYVRPSVSDDAVFEIVGGRHPVVEQALRKERQRAFIENDCVLVEGGAPEALTGFDERRAGRLWLVTGPNMAGKSTFLRQNALIVVLAQMGSFVPARSARLGIVDRLFSRVGAADDIARGRSTFMVEMVETAAILNAATERSLVILDEIGRGTATFDGLSIAWATVEHLHDVNRCRALFATHYHELTALAGRLAEVVNVTMDVKEWQDDIVFLHKVRPGAADRSYGIQVAKLAGLPAVVVKRATEVLRKLEKSDRRAEKTAALDDLPLFKATRPESVIAEPRRPSAIEAALAGLNPDELTPRQALDALYALKKLTTI